MNRLDLNFNLSTNTERADFVRTYLSQSEFISHPPNEDESETIANYILWGKDPQTGLNSRQSKDIQLQTRGGTWDTHQNESLDALYEQPGFNETFTRTLNEPKTYTTRTTFSRADARRDAPPHLLPQLESLWNQIDYIDLLINFYDIAHNKRTQPPRESLLKKFPPD